MHPVSSCRRKNSNRHLYRVSAMVASFLQPGLDRLGPHCAADWMARAIAELLGIAYRGSHWGKATGTWIERLPTAATANPAAANRSALDLACSRCAWLTEQDLWRDAHECFIGGWMAILPTIRRETRAALVAFADASSTPIPVLGSATALSPLGVPGSNTGKPPPRECSSHWLLYDRCELCHHKAHGPNQFSLYDAIPESEAACVYYVADDGLGAHPNAHLPPTNVSCGWWQQQRNAHILSIRPQSRIIALRRGEKFEDFAQLVFAPNVIVGWAGSSWALWSAIAANTGTVVIGEQSTPDKEPPGVWDRFLPTLQSRRGAKAMFPQHCRVLTAGATVARDDRPSTQQEKLEATALADRDSVMRFMLDRGGVDPQVQVQRRNAALDATGGATPDALGQTDSDQARTICVFGGNERQASLFGGNVKRELGKQFLARYGSTHRFQYQGNAKEVDPHQACASFGPEQTLYLLRPERETPLFLEFRANQTIYGRRVFVAIVGDELCLMTAAESSELSTIPGFIGRQYASSAYDGAGFMYIPLGPRFEFEPAFGSVPDKARTHLWNFVGSLNTERTIGPRVHGGRASLKAALDSWTARGDDTYLHIARAWNEHPSRSNGNVAPADYQRAVVDSYYTLCPAGRSFETFRFWEAVDSGSVPVVVLQGHIEQSALTGVEIDGLSLLPGRAAEHASRTGTKEGSICEDPFRRVLDTKPPIIIMQDWAAAVAFLEERRLDPELQAKAAGERRELMAWATQYWQQVAREIDVALTQKSAPLPSGGGLRTSENAAAADDVAEGGATAAATLTCAGHYHQYGHDRTASTLQWYVNKPRFLCNARRVTAGRPSGGHAAAATPRVGRPPLLGGRLGGLCTALIGLTSALLTSTLLQVRCLQRTAAVRAPPLEDRCGRGVLPASFGRKPRSRRAPQLCDDLQVPHQHPRRRCNRALHISKRSTAVGTVRAPPGASEAAGTGSDGRGPRPGHGIRAQ